MLEIKLLIPSPADMPNLEAKYRQFWRIGDVLARTLHEIFLMMGEQDVVMIEGKTTDSFSLHAVGQILGSAGWCVLVTENLASKKLYVGYDRATVHRVAGQPMPVQQEETNDVQGQTDGSGSGSEGKLPAITPGADIQGDDGVDRPAERPEQEDLEEVPGQDESQQVLDSSS